MMSLYVSSKASRHLSGVLIAQNLACKAGVFFVLVITIGRHLTEAWGQSKKLHSVRGGQCEMVVGEGEGERNFFSPPHPYPRPSSQSSIWCVLSKWRLVTNKPPPAKKRLLCRLHKTKLLMHCCCGNGNLPLAMSGAAL